MTGEDYEAARPVPARSGVTGDPWRRSEVIAYLATPIDAHYLRTLLIGLDAVVSVNDDGVLVIETPDVQVRVNRRGVAANAFIADEPFGSNVTTTAKAAFGAFVDWESPEDQQYDEHLDPCDCDDCRPIVMHNYDSEPDLPNEEEPRKCAVCGEPVRVTTDGHPYHYSARADIGDHHATLAEFEHGAFCECPRCNEQFGAPVKVEQPPNPAQTEPPVGAVVRCFGCGNVYIHKPHGWWNTDDGSTSPSLDGIKRPSCGPLRVIYTPEEDK